MNEFIWISKDRDGTAAQFSIKPDLTESGNWGENILGPECKNLDNPPDFLENEQLWNCGSEEIPDFVCMQLGAIKWDGRWWLQEFEYDTITDEESVEINRNFRD